MRPPSHRLRSLRTGLAAAALAALPLPMGACDADAEPTLPGPGPATDGSADPGPGGGADAGLDTSESWDSDAGPSAPCGPATGPVCEVAETCVPVVDGDGAPVDGLCVANVDPSATCGGGTAWSVGRSVFVERTADWGLTGVAGARVNIGDVDGDGWPDLVLRRGGTRRDDYGPQGVRHHWVLRNTGAAGAVGFEDVTQASGLWASRAATDGLGRPGDVVALADVDNDGDLDVYAGFGTSDPTATGGETSELMLNQGDGTFVFGDEASPLRRAGTIDSVAGASFVDYDRDGALDLWLPQHNYLNAAGGQVFVGDRLFKGDGQGGFADVTAAMGLATAEWSLIADLNQGLAHTRAWGAAACDLDGDGWTELLAPSYGRSPNHLWQLRDLDSGLRFENRSVASGYAYDLDFTWTDNQFAACYCQANPGAPDCDKTGPPLVSCGQVNWNHDYDREAFRLGGNSGATRCADVDNDGDLDLVTGEIRHWWAGSGSDGSEVLLNTGASDVVFERPGDEALGLAIDHQSVTWDEGHMTGTVFDFDNDGWQDLYVGASDYAGNRGLLYRNLGPVGRDTVAGVAFEEVPPLDFFEHNRSHGVGVADLDQDGDLDIVVGHSRARCDANAANNCYDTANFRVFENVLADAGRWLQLELTGGQGSNRGAVGARVTVEAGGERQLFELGGGYGHYGAQDDRIVHVGLGDACEARVTVRWPDAALTTETFEVPAGWRYRVTQGEGVVALQR